MEWSKPMTKKKMMTALGFDSYKTFKVFARRHGIKQAGNRQTHQLSMRQLSSENRERLRRV